MERKHLRMDGRGLSQWGTDATARAHAHRGKVRASKAVIDRLKAKGLISQTLEKGLAPRTNLDRVLQRSEEHTSELPSLMRITYAVLCLKKNKNTHRSLHTTSYNYVTC